MITSLFYLIHQVQTPRGKHFSGVNQTSWYKLTTEHRDQITEKWLQEYKEHVQLLIGQNWPTEIPKVKIAILDTGIDLSHE